MATTYITLTGDINDLTDGEFDTRRLKVTLVANTTKIVDSDTGAIHLGTRAHVNSAGKRETEADGTFSFADVIAATDLVENLQYYVRVDYPQHYPRGNRNPVETFGPYDLSGETGTVDLATLEAVQALDPHFISEARTEFQGYLDDGQALVDQQEEIAGLADSDEAQAYNITNGTATPAALSAASDARIRTTVPADLADDESDIALATDTRIDERELTALIKSINTWSTGGRVAIIGDSISAGPRSGSPYAFYANCRGRLWHDWWFYLAYQRTRSVGNYSVGAKDLQHARDVQIPAMLRQVDQFPDAAVIAHGTNNWDDYLADPDAAWDLLLQVVAILVHRGIRPILTTIPPHPQAGFATAWNARVRTFATATGLPYVERNTPVKGANEDTWAASMSDDGTHPNDAGHRTIGVAVAADATLAAAFLPAYPDFDFSTGAGASTDLHNLAGPLWNTFGGTWDVSAWAADTGNRYWLDRTLGAGYPGTPTVEAVNLVAPSGARTASFTVDCTVDIDIFMFSRKSSGAFSAIYVEPLDASDVALSPSIYLDQYMAASSTAREGAIGAHVKAPAGTAKFKVSFEVSGTTWFGAITIREAARLG